MQPHDPLPGLATRERVIDAALVVICGVVQAASAAVAAFATRDAFAALHAGTSLTSDIPLRLGGAGLATAACLYFAQQRSEALGQSYANAMRQRLYRQIATLPKSRHQERRLGGLALRFVGDLSAARLWFGRGLPDVLTALIVLPAALAILFTLDSRLAPAGILPVALALCLMLAVARQLEQRHRGVRTRRASLAILMIERIGISPELDLMGRTDRELRDLERRGKTLREHATARRGRTALLQALLSCGTAFAGLLILWRASQTGAAPGTVAASLAVLALVALPLQNLATAWDRFCAWRVAREKALALFSEPTVARRITHRKTGVDVSIVDPPGDHARERRFPKGRVSFLESGSGSGSGSGRQLARQIAGLDASAHATITFDGSESQPKTAYIGDNYTGLQGSLRRSATLLCRKRSEDAHIRQTLEDYEFWPDPSVGTADKTLDTRITEGAHELTAEQTLRLEFARAELGKVDLLVIDSVRWRATKAAHALTERFAKRSEATVVVAGSACVDGGVDSSGGSGSRSDGLKERRARRMHA